MIKKYTFLFLIFTGFSSASFSQESMMTDVSYVLLEKLISTAKENYPRFAGYDSRLALAKTDISSAQVSWLDAFSFSYVYNPDNAVDLNNPLNNQIFFRGYQAAISVNLGAILQKPSAVKRARESLKLVQHDLDEYNLTIESEVKRRYFAYVQSLNLLKLQTKLAADVMNIGKDIRSRYEKSEVNFEQYTQSQMAYTGALQSKIMAESNFLSAKASLEELLTKKIEEVQ